MGVWEIKMVKNMKEKKREFESSLFETYQSLVPTLACYMFNEMINNIAKNIELNEKISAWFTSEYYI